MAEFSGVVIQSTGSWYEVRRDDGTVERCRIRGKLRLKGVRSTNPVVVGDRGRCDTDESGEHAIVAVSPRSNYIIRRASNLSKESHIIAANIDRALLAVTLASPPSSTEFIDRFLVTCEAYKIPVVIALNKVDMLEGMTQERETFRRVYASAGYEVVETSAVQGVGLDCIKQLLKDRVTLVSGNSGVGKSTLVKTLEPGLEIRTGEVSEAHHKGRHTTTFSRMYPLREGGCIIDTPGIKGFGLIDIAAGELYHYFPEMMRVGAQCRFYNCTHTHEPGCAVREAVERGEIAWQRYESYLKIMEEDDKYRK